MQVEGKTPWGYQWVLSHQDSPFARILQHANQLKPFQSNNQPLKHMRQGVIFRIGPVCPASLDAPTFCAGNLLFQWKTSDSKTSDQSIHILDNIMAKLD